MDQLTFLLSWPQWHTRSPEIVLFLVNDFMVGSDELIDGRVQSEMELK